MQYVYDTRPKTNYIKPGFHMVMQESCEPECEIEKNGDKIIRYFVVENNLQFDNDLDHLHTEKFNQRLKL